MQAVREILPDILAALKNRAASTQNQLAQKWESIVGPKIASHTRSSLTKRGELTVWVDQSALAFELRQKYGEVLLSRVRAAVGEQAVKSVRFLVGQIRA